MTCLSLAVPRVVASLIALTSIAGAQQPEARVATREFVVAHGSDSIATEQYSRTATDVQSNLVIEGQGLRFTFTLILGTDATVSRMETAVRRASAPASSAPLQRVTLSFADDSVLVMMGDASTPSQRVAVPSGTLPFVNLSSAILEQILLRAKALGGATADVPLFNVSGGQILHAKVRWAGTDSAIIAFPNSELHAHVSSDGRLLGGTVPSQGLRFIETSREVTPAPHIESTHVAGTSAVASATRVKPDYSAPPGAPYSAEEVRVQNAKANVTLAGTLIMPDHAAGARVPAVLMITGSGAEDRDESTPALPGWRPFREIADTLGRRGIAVLRLDDRGVGRSDAGPRGATSADFADDIRAALAYLRTRSDVDPGRLGLIGHSEGAIIAPMVAATDPTVHAVVLIAGSSRTGRAVSDAQVREAIHKRLGLGGASLDSAIRANDVARDAQLAASPWLRFWFDYDPLPTAKRVRSPVLVVQGATDTQVSPDQANELAAAIRSGGNHDVTVRIIPETNHLLVHDPDGSFTNYASLPSLAVNSVVLGTIADWLVARMH